MRTKQSVDFEKQESTWIYLLHEQAPPQIWVSTAVSLPPLDVVSRTSNDGALFDKQQSSLNVVSRTSNAGALFGQQQSSLDVVSRTSNASALFGQQQSSPPTLPTRRLLLSSSSATTSTMMLSSQNRAWTPSKSLLALSLPGSNGSEATPKSTAGASPHHGNKRATFPKKCDFPLCKNGPRSRGFCYSHGGGRRCRVDGCNNGAVSHDLCKRHGGGRRCRMDGCRRSSESGGLCYSHGGGRRCSILWCSARAKKGGFCAVHLMEDRMSPSTRDVLPVHSSVVESLLTLAKDQSNAKMEKVTPSLNSSGKSAYAIASLLN